MHFGKATQLFFQMRYFNNLEYFNNFKLLWIGTHGKNTHTHRNYMELVIRGYQQHLYSALPQGATLVHDTIWLPQPASYIVDMLNTKSQLVINRKLIIIFKCYSRQGLLLWLEKNISHVHKYNQQEEIRTFKSNQKKVGRKGEGLLALVDVNWKKHLPMNHCKFIVFETPSDSIADAHNQ